MSEYLKKIRWSEAVEAGCCWEFLEQKANTTGGIRRPAITIFMSVCVPVGLQPSTNSSLVRSEPEGGQLLGHSLSSQGVVQHQQVHRCCWDLSASRCLYLMRCRFPRDRENPEPFSNTHTHTSGYPFLYALHSQITVHLAQKIKTDSLNHVTCQVQWYRQRCDVKHARMSASKYKAVTSYPCYSSLVKDEIWHVLVSLKINRF